MSHRVESERHYFYVLHCRDGSYYAGYITDPARREKEHNQGVGSKYTFSRRPVRMIYQEAFSSRSDAMKAEAGFKKLTRRQKERFLTGRGTAPRGVSRDHLPVKEETNDEDPEKL